MKITITIDTNEISHLNANQAHIIKEELARITERFSDSNFYSRIRESVGLKSEEPLVGQVGFTQYDVLIKHTVEAGDYSK
jgi:hypothetical protein